MFMTGHGGSQSELPVFHSIYLAAEQHGADQAGLSARHQGQSHRDGDQERASLCGTDNEPDHAPRNRHSIPADGRC